MRRAGLVVAVAAVLAIPATARADTPTWVLGSDCHEQQAWVDGDEAAVAARLPKRYTPVRDNGTGKPLLFVRALRCARTSLGGIPNPVVASYGIVVQSPDGRGCGSALPVIGPAKGDGLPVCNWYTLALLTNDRAMASWLGGWPVRYTNDLVYSLSDPDFHFRAPGFGIDATWHERPGELSVRGGYWTDTADGTLELPITTDDLVSGDATGTVTAGAGSELSELLGSTRAEYAPGYSQFSAQRFGRGIYRRQLYGPARAGEQLDSFAGDCSVQGDVTFSPPANNTSQALRYDYAAKGTCTGTLDGRKVSDAPVTLRQGGNSQGGCQQAATTTPGEGVLTFASGEAIGFTLDFTTHGTDVSGEGYGLRSGIARGSATFATQRTGPDLLANCAGDGAKTAPMDLKLTTDTPLVAERSQAARATPGRFGASGGAPARARLRVRVTPRRARAGRRTRFAFRVTTADGRPVRGARVWFAGRRARTSRTGRAVIAATLHGRGHRTVRATLAGSVAARATILVRRR